MCADLALGKLQAVTPKNLGQGYDSELWAYLEAKALFTIYRSLDTCSLKSSNFSTTEANHGRGIPGSFLITWLSTNWLSETERSNHFTGYVTDRLKPANHEYKDERFDP